MQPIRFILVGGFLGAGKTTLLGRATERLIQRGMRVGLITNDQAADLVDTEVLKTATSGVKEVAGGCFCCGFNRLLHACDQLIDEFQPSVLLGEPVGSCADISATVIQPLKKYCADRFVLAPYCVLAEPTRLAASLASAQDDRLSDNVRYIFRKQLEEADRILLSKVDLLTPEDLDRIKAIVARELPDRPIMEISSLRGDGLDAWLDTVMHEEGAGRRVVEMNYVTYAQGEHQLGWLSALVRLRAKGQQSDWGGYCRTLLTEIQSLCREESVEIAHAKLFCRATEGFLSANLTSTADAPSVQGEIPVTVSAVALIINARALVHPEHLRRIIQQALDRSTGPELEMEVVRIKSFSPAPPEPVHRFDAPVEEAP